jgi:hypothetical protein
MEGMRDYSYSHSIHCQDTIIRCIGTWESVCMMAKSHAMNPSGESPCYWDSGTDWTIWAV